MFVSTTPQSAIRELDRRTSDGIEVSLLWNSRTNQVSVAVEDRHGGELFEVTVQGADALDAFRHPYTYRASELLPMICPGTAGRAVASHVDFAAPSRVPRRCSLSRSDQRVVVPAPESKGKSEMDVLKTDERERNPRAPAIAAGGSRSSRCALAF
jgi:hypothetical protein